LVGVPRSAEVQESTRRTAESESEVLYGEKRPGQSGTIVRKGNFWHIRYLHDTPNGRIRKSVPVGRCDELTKPQARRLGDTYLHEIGVNTPQCLERAMAAPTFDAALQKWREACLVGFKPSGKQPTGYCVNKHIVPKFSGMLLEEVSKQAVQVWIHELNTSGLEPKTVRNIVKMLKSILNWNEVGTRDWKLRLPELPDDEQRWFTPDEVMNLIEAADKFPKRRHNTQSCFAWLMRAGCVRGNYLACMFRTSISMPER
jgi:hypothetical protein